MPKIFLSYRRQDRPAHAGRLYDRLVAEFGREQVFMDIDAIDLGVDFVDRINESVGSCDVLLALIGPEWLSERMNDPHDFVRLEVATALKRDVRVVPLLVDGAAMPSAEELPDDLRALVRRHALELGYTRWRHDADMLVDTLRRLDQPEDAGVGPAGPDDVSKRRRLVPAVAAILALAAAGAVALVLAGGDGDEPAESGHKPSESTAAARNGGQKRKSEPAPAAVTGVPVRIEEAGFATMRPPGYRTTTKEFEPGTFQTVFAKDGEYVAVLKTTGRIPSKPNGNVTGAHSLTFSEQLVDGTQIRYEFKGGTCPDGARCVAWVGGSIDGDGYKISGLIDDPFVDLVASSINDEP